MMSSAAASGADGQARRPPPVARTYSKQRSVQVLDSRDDDIIEVHEKHGPLYNAIPRMPVPVAAVCCLFNIVCPGLGTFISAFTVLCGAPTTTGKRLNAFCLNILSAFLQMVTFLVIVGWVWSIIWGMNMVQLSVNHGEEAKGSYYCRRQSSIDVLG